MKTRKILASALAISSLGTVASIAGCSTKGKDVDPTVDVDVDPSTPKNVEVSANQEFVHYKFNAKSFPSPEKTDAALTNLYVNDVPVTEETGWLTHTLEDNFIICTFNLKAAIQESNAEKINFDIKFSDQQTNWEKTVTGFSIKIDRKASAVTYSLTNGIELTKAPESINPGEDLDVQFRLKSGYEYLSDQCDIKVNDTSIKSEEGVIINLEDGKIHVPSEYINDNSTIAITLKADGKTYTISKSVDQNITLDDQKISAGIKHAEEGTVSIDYSVAAYYQLSGNITVKDNVTGQTVEGCKVQNNQLIIPCASVVNNITIIASTKAKKYNITLGQSVQNVIHFTTTQVDHDTVFNGTITCDKGYKLNSPIFAVFEDETGSPESKYIDLDNDGNFTIPKGDVKGGIILSPTVNGETYNINTSFQEEDYIKFTGAGTVVHPADYTATIEPKDKYHTFNNESDSWDCKLNSSQGDSLKEFITWDGNELTVPGDKIVGDLYFSATASAKSWDVKLNKTSASHITTAKVKQATWDKDYSVELTIDDDQYDYAVESAKCTDADESKGEIDITNKISLIKKSGENKLTLKITDKTVITGEISIKFTQTPKSYSVTKPTDANIDFTGADSITHDDVDYTATVTVKDTEKFKVKADSISVTQISGSELVKGTDYTFTVQSSNKYKYDLWIDQSKINSNVTISVTAENATFDYAVTKDSGFSSITPATGTATYGTDLELTYELEPGKKIDTSNTKCVVSSPKGTQTTLTIGNGITDDGNGKFIIAGSAITGSLAFDGVTANVVYTISAGTTTGFGINGTAPTTTYHAAVDIPLTMTTDYVLNTNDFSGSNPNIKLMMGGNALAYGTDFTVTTTAGSENIHINENVVEGNITLSGEVTQYNVTSSQTASAFKTLPTTFVTTKNTGFSKTAKLNNGYADSTIVVSCGTTTFTKDTDYTVTTNNDVVTVNVTATEKIVGPISMVFDAVATTISFGGGCYQLAIGDTSPAFTATASPSGASATISLLKDSTATDTTFTDNKLTAGSVVGRADLNAVYQGATKYTGIPVKMAKANLTKSSGKAYVGGSIDLSYSWDTGSDYAVPSTTAQSAAVATWSSSDTTVADFETVTTEAGVTTNVLNCKAAGNTTITLKVKYGTLQGTEIQSTLDVEVINSTKKIGFNITSKPEYMVVNGLTDTLSPVSPIATITAYSTYEDTHGYKYNCAGYFKFTCSSPSVSKSCELCVVPYRYTEEAYTLSVDFTDVFDQMSEDQEITLDVEYVEVKGGSVGWVVTMLVSKYYEVVQAPNNIFNVEGRRDPSFTIKCTEEGNGKNLKITLSPYYDLYDTTNMGSVTTGTMTTGTEYAFTLTATTDTSRWNNVSKGQLYLVVKEA